MARPALTDEPKNYTGSAFDLANEDAYGAWRAQKLSNTPAGPKDVLVPIADLSRPSAAEVGALISICTKTNFALYRSSTELTAEASRLAVIALGQKLGLRHLDANPSSGGDGLTAIEASGGVPGRDYIPHTDKPLNWHTDGYYNPPDRQVRAMTLHCVRAAEDGGANILMDPELVYIRLRDQDPALIAALSRSDAMTIPANIHQGREIRAAQTGPVFSIDPATGALHTRYTARSRSIVWRDDEQTRAAVRALEAVLQSPGLDAVSYRLAPGEGVISNNVIHRREGFRDAPQGPGRMMLRGRYYERVGAHP